MTTFTTTEAFQLAFDFINRTGDNLFLTGKAGTGKTTFLKKLKESSPKRIVVAAPTGIAAINANGVTLHSLFHLPFEPQAPNFYLPENERVPEPVTRFSKMKRDLIRSIQLLVIDEISMVRADLLDAVDATLRKLKESNKPFGGTQVVMIGDLQQLAPVVKESDQPFLKRYYAGPFFFQSRVLQNFPVRTIELDHIFRQSDSRFIDILNEVRENRLSPQNLAILNSRYLPESQIPDDCIVLTSHNKKAQTVNLNKLNALNTKAHQFNADVIDNFPGSAFPNDEKLILKIGAQVMFTKNDPTPNKLYFNGKIGEVVQIENETVTVKCSESEQLIEVGKAEWHNYNYKINPKTNEIEEEIIGKFCQIPLKTAWAITIHKSQGLTFDKAILDVNEAFTHGQVYVALSRCRSLEGLFLATPIQTDRILSNQSVNQFSQSARENPLTQETLKQLQIQYEHEVICQLFNFQKLYSITAALHKEYTKNENSIIDAQTDTLNDFLLHLNEHIHSVSLRFKPQLATLFTTDLPTESDAPLQTRIIQAVKYFRTQFKSASEIWKNLSAPESDNKKLKTDLISKFDKISEALAMHQITLESCSQGFQLMPYLKAYSTSHIKATSAPTLKQPKQNGTLYFALKEWRDQKADQMNKPLYMILPTKTVITLSEKRPESIQELSKIKGIGKTKIQQFGDEILSIINDYSPIEPKTIPTTETEKKKKKTTRSSQENEQLLQFRNNEVSARTAVSDEEVQMILEAIKQSKNSSITLLKKKCMLSSFKIKAALEVIRQEDLI